MANSLSNTVKAVLYPDNYLDRRQGVPRYQCLDVQAYEYQLERSRNSFGEAYGSGSGNMITIKVSVNTKDSLRVFYERLSDTFSTSLTLIFNAHYDQDDNITPYNHDGAIVLTGYIVDVDEACCKSKTDRHNDEIMLTLRFLANKMVMVGDSHDLVFDFRS